MNEPLNLFPVTPCVHEPSAFGWKVDDANHILFAIPTAHGGTPRWFDTGLAHDTDNGPFARIADSAFRATPLTWRTEVSRDADGKVQDSDERLESFRAEDERRELELLARVGAATSQRLDPSRGWRMLSPNCVTHFQFGPAVTVATDGVRVILFSWPRFGDDWFMAHRDNVQGPVTSTPVRTAEWDYYTNRPKTASKPGTKRKPKPSSVALATSLLEQLIAQHQKPAASQ